MWRVAQEDEKVSCDICGCDIHEGEDYESFDNGSSNYCESCIAKADEAQDRRNNSSCYTGGY